MQIKTPTQFETFNDGAASLWSVKNNKLDKRIGHYYFGDETISYKRYYTARAASVVFDRVIHVHMIDTIDAATHNITIGKTRYKIEQQQQIRSTNPPITRLTLRKVGVIRDG